MTPEFAYFVKVNIAFALFYAFYRLFFYKDTFFKLRRAILLSFFGLALLYPFLNIQEWIRQQEPIAEVILIYSSIMAPEATVTAERAVTGTNWMELLEKGVYALYFGGIACLFARFFAQFTSILWLARKSRRRILSGISVYSLEKPAGPFSFFSLIFIHPESHSQKEIDEILTHECTHVSQWHSIDVMISELVSIICWFNPFVWLLKREVRHNLEYLADNTVIEAGYDSKSYQYHLLGLAHHQKGNANLYNSFNVLHLKNRIGMMNKKRSRGIVRTKYLVFIPLVAALMLLSNMEAVARLTRQVAHLTVTNPERSTTEEMFPDLNATPYPGSVQEVSNDIDIPSSDVELRLAPVPPALPEHNIEATIIENEAESAGNMVFTVVENMPRFPGGDQALISFIDKNTKYPEEAYKNKIQGRVVASFIVTKDGSLRNIEITRGISPVLDDEAVRVIKSMPKWTPGKQRGQAVDVKYTVPINFRIEEETSEDHVFTVVEEMPHFPGGDAALLKHITQNIKYPVIAQENGIQGRVVASFVVNSDGRIVDPEVVRGIDPSLDKEALRIIETMPDWSPGKQRGKSVRVKYTVPIQFRLQ